MPTSTTFLRRCQKRLQSAAAESSAMAHGIDVLIVDSSACSSCSARPSIAYARFEWMSRAQRACLRCAILPIASPVAFVQIAPARGLRIGGTAASAIRILSCCKLTLSRSYRVLVYHRCPRSTCPVLSAIPWSTRACMACRRYFRRWWIILSQPRVMHSQRAGQRSVEFPQQQLIVEPF